jgi:hypothetical protein
LREIAYAQATIRRELLVHPAENGDQVELLWAADEGEGPRVVKQSGTLVLILPERMKAALAAYDSTFQPWEFDDYTLTIRSDPDYSEQRAPFALITEVNTDGIPDGGIARSQDYRTLQ